MSAEAPHQSFPKTGHAPHPTPAPTYLPGHGGQHGRGQHAEEHQALRDEAEVADAPGGHDLVQAAAARALRPPRLLALAQLGVEAPHGDEQDHVAHAPEEAEEAEARDDQVPELQVGQLQEEEEEESTLGGWR